MATETTLDDLLARRRARRSVYREAPWRALRLLRQRAGLTQTEIAKVLNCNVATVIRWERGQRVPRPAQAERLAALVARLEQET